MNRGGILSFAADTGSNGGAGAAVTQHILALTAQPATLLRRLRRRIAAEGGAVVVSDITDFCVAVRPVARRWQSPRQRQTAAKETAYDVSVAAL